MASKKRGLTRIVKARINADRIINAIVILLTSAIFVIRNFFLLILSPYKTMRKISQEKDYWQPVIVIIFVFIYFVVANKIRRFYYPPSLIFLAFLLFFLFTIFFFYLLSLIFNKKEKLESFFLTFSYSLFPTLIWFITNSIIYYFLPPPRTMSLMGKGFSIFFIAFSLSLFLWKIILLYLSIRFSSRLTFFKIMFLMVLYLCIFFPLTVIFYQLKIFRVPFI